MPEQVANNTPAPTTGVSSAPLPQHGDGGRVALAACLIALAAAAAYHNALSTPFVFDDQFGIVDNTTIRHLGQIGEVLRPPPYVSGAAGRPLVNLTLAINYAFDGLDVRGYHAMNLGLHILAGLALFGLIRQTLKSTAVAKDSYHIALASAVVWVVHPLLTESVTCVIQRNEVLAGLCYLLTLYCFVRGVKSPGSALWLPLASLCCLLGMAAKEIMVSAPLIVLLYDRTFVTGTFRSAWRERRGFYLALASTWLLLGWLMLGSQHRGGTVGFGLGVTGWDYLLTQCRAIVIYLKLSVWPHPLVIDYGTAITTQISKVALQSVGLVLLATGTAVSVMRRSAVGFLGACFFAILAPSSSVVPLVTQPIAEHRMYLPLAVVVVLAVTGLHRAMGRIHVFVWAVVALVLGTLTVQRNVDYHSEVSLIQGALAANPRNDRAYLNLGTLASREGRTAEAISDYEQALRLDPRAADTHHNLALMLEQTGRPTEAIAHYREAVRLRSGYPAAQYHLGLALAKIGQADDAIANLEQALLLQPGSSAVRQSLALIHSRQGDSLAQAGRIPEAIVHYEAVLRFLPDDAHAHNNLGNAFSQLGRSLEAIGHYEAALQAAPHYAEAHYNLAVELLDANRLPEARTHFLEVLRLRPDDEQTRQQLAQIDAKLRK